MRSRDPDHLASGDHQSKTEHESSFYQNTGLERPEGWHCDGNFYHRLNLEGRSATTDDIKEAYKKLAKIWHPDKHSGKTFEEREVAEENFRQIHKAYAVLTSPTQRKIYDLYGIKGIENAEALVKCSDPKNTDDPTPIELLVGGSVYKQKMAEKELLRQHKTHVTNARISYDALEVFKQLKQDQSQIAEEILDTFDEVFPYAIKLDTAINFPGFLNIENLNLRNHYSIDLEYDVVEAMVGSDFNYTTADGRHNFEMQNYWKIDTVGLLTKDTDPLPNQITSCFLYEFRYKSWMVRNFLPVVFEVLPDGRPKIRPSVNRFTVSMPFLKSDVHRYFSSLKLVLKINPFNLAKTSLQINVENIVTNDTFLGAGSMTQIVASPGMNFSLNPESPIQKNLMVQFNLSNNYFLSVDMEKDCEKVQIKFNQKVSQFSTLKTGVTLKKESVSLDLGFKKGGLDLDFPVLVSDDGTVTNAILLAAGIGLGVLFAKKTYKDYQEHKKRELHSKMRMAKFDQVNDSSLISKIFKFLGQSEKEKKVQLLEKLKHRHDQLAASEKKAAGILKVLEETYQVRLAAAVKRPNGLVIKEAYYGDFLDTTNNSFTSSGLAASSSHQDLIFDATKLNSSGSQFAKTYNQDSLKNLTRRKQYIDVTKQLQCLVHNDKLQLPKNSCLKDRITDGFYDPSFDVSGESAPLKLRIKYMVNGDQYYCEYSDGARVNVPKRADFVRK